MPVASIRLRISRTATESLARSGSSSAALTSASTCKHRCTAAALQAFHVSTRSATPTSFRFLIWSYAVASVEESGGKPYAIPAGASDHPLGGLGFARWADEVAAQERELGVFFDTVVVCSVTGSTQAGMIAGFAAQESDRAVLGIDGSATVEQTWAQIARIARFTAEAIGLGRDLDDSEIVLLDEWNAGTYGIPDEKTIDAIRLCARLEGVLTDPVYEGKSMAALIDLVRSGRLAPGSRVLYAHLGGQPALNAYAGVF
jgi:1-aminocyclopropane-1-carboxylate deaminase